MSEYKKLAKGLTKPPVPSVYIPFAAGIDVPRVLGLTASLIKEKIAPSKLEGQLLKLESVLESSIETASDLVAVCFQIFRCPS